MTFIARPYQLEASESLFGYFERHGGNPLIGLPTGTGKSVIPPLFINQALTTFPRTRVLLATHVKELISQNVKAMRRIWPMCPIGICSAGLDKWEPWAPVVYAGIASIYKKANELGRFDIMFIDEAHLLSPDDNTMYQAFIADMRAINPYFKVIGMSATLFRMGQGMLTDGDSIFTDVCYDKTGLREFCYFLDEYYLSPLVPKPTQTVIDISDVRQLANDYNQKDLARAVDKESVTRSALEESLAYAADRNRWMVFGAGIENCHHLTDMLNQMGVSATLVHSKLTDEQRDTRLAAFEHGRYKAIVSYGILTTGFDDPKVDCIIDLRPTTSVVLHVQKYGRGTRPYFHPAWTPEQLRHKDERRKAMEAGGKRNCMVLDFAGNTNRLGPINDPKIPNPKGGGTGEMPVKLCPECDGYNHTTVRFCALCGFEFIFRVKIKTTASEDDLIRRDERETKLFDVENITRQIHQSRRSGGNTLKVTYFCANMKAFPTWLSFDASSKEFAKHKARDWWRQHFGDTIPTSTAEAFEWFPQARRAKQILVAIPSQGYPEILEYRF